jgi:hypothetical protein
MSGRRFVKAVPAALVVVTALALTVFSGDPQPSRSPLGFTVDSGVLAAPVEPVLLRRRTITPEFNPPLEVRADRVVFARGSVACDPGEIFRVNVTVEQGTTTGRGVTVGRCTGEVQEWTAVVVARRGGTYQSGPSTACAVATTLRRGVTDTFEWCGTPLLAAD